MKRKKKQKKKKRIKGEIKKNGRMEIRNWRSIRMQFLEELKRHSGLKLNEIISWEKKHLSHVLGVSD